MKSEKKEPKVGLHAVGRSLKLSRETLRKLTPLDLKSVQGGGDLTGRQSTCQSCGCTL
jgi:hypothetical protein